MGFGDVRNVSVGEAKGTCIMGRKTCLVCMWGDKQTLHTNLQLQLVTTQKEGTRYW